MDVLIILTIKAAIILTFAALFGFISVRLLFNYVMLDINALSVFLAAVAYMVIFFGVNVLLLSDEVRSITPQKRRLL